MEFTDKPIAFVAHNLDNMREVYKIAARQVGSMEKLAERPFLITLLEPCTPFVFPEEILKKIFWCSEHQMSFCFNSAILLGACIGTLDIRRGTFSVGTPGYILANASFVQITRSLHIPAWTNGCCTQGKAVDQQAAAEVMMSAFMPADIVYDAGYLESGMFSSLEMCVMADEFISYAPRILRQGISVDGDSIALDVIAEVRAGGNFLDTDHTFDHFHEELWMPQFMNRDPFDIWEQDGHKTMRQRIREKIDSILEKAE